MAFLFVPLLPEIITSVSEKEGIEASPFLSDKASGIYNSAYGIGNCLAPIIGGAITQARNFRFTCDVMGIASLSFSILYLCFAVIPGILHEKKAKSKQDYNYLAETLQPGALDNSNTQYDMALEFENNRKINLSGTFNQRTSGTTPVSAGDQQQTL